MLWSLGGEGSEVSSLRRRTKESSGIVSSFWIVQRPVSGSDPADQQIIVYQTVKATMPSSRESFFVWEYKYTGSDDRHPHVKYDLLNPSGHQHRTDSPLQHDLSEEHAICRICRLNSQLSCAAMNLRQKNTRDRYLEIPPESQNPMLDRSKNLRRTAAKLCAIGRSRADLRESTAQSIGHVDQENRSKEMERHFVAPLHFVI